MRTYSFKVQAVNVLPSGRISEYVARFSEDQKQRAAIKHGRRIGDDDTVKIFPNRQAMAKVIRRGEKAALVSEWWPLVKLTDGEGY